MTAMDAASKEEWMVISKSFTLVVELPLIVR